MTVWTAIVLGGVATYLMRALPLVVTLSRYCGVAEGNTPSSRAQRMLREYLDALPIAVLAALVGAGVAVPDGQLTGGAEVVAAGVAFALASWRRNLLVAVVGGVVVVAALRALGL